MAVVTVSGNQWKATFGSLAEVMEYMGTGSINPIDIKGFVAPFPATGSLTVIYNR